MPTATRIFKQGEDILWVIRDEERRPLPGCTGKTRLEAIEAFCKSRRAWKRHSLFGRRKAVRIDLEAGARAARGEAGK